MNKVERSPTEDQIAHFLEGEAYRIRTVAKFGWRHADFVESFIGAVRENVGPISGIDQTREDQRLRAIDSGLCKVVGLYGGRRPIKSRDGIQKYDRTLIMKIDDEQIELQFTTLWSQADGYQHEQWSKSHEPTMRFLEGNENICDVIAEIFNQEQEDFFLDSGDMSSNDAAMFFASIINHLNSQKELGNATKATQQPDDNCPSP